MSEMIPTALQGRESHAPADASGPDRALAPVRRGLRLLSLGLVGVMIGLPALQVVLREVLNLPFVGAEELTRFMLICVVFVTLPYVVASGANIRLEEGLALLPGRVQAPIRILIAASGAAAFAMAAMAIGYAMMRNLQNATPTLGIPYWIFFAASLVGFAVAAIECAVQTWKLATSRPPYISFPDEALPDDMEALEEALVAQSTRGTDGSAR